MVKIQLILPALFRPHRLAWPRTLPFQGSNTGSNPVGDTTFDAADPYSSPYFHRDCRLRKEILPWRFLSTHGTG